MRTLLKWLMVVGMVFQFMSSSVYGGTKDIIIKNELKAQEYITQLKAGADPNSLTRPRLRRHHKWRVKRSARELKKDMDAAEALARAGKHHLIQEPDYIFQDMSEEKIRTLRDIKKNRK